MHKSVMFTFVLLASSLVMLAIVPLFSNNNTVAMAQGYDNYYGDNSYSQYPTYDNKYECRTGPFEGFFVSSVEFCKHVKFEDNKKDRDGKVGPQGPQGPQGPKGDTGATGPQGPAGANGTDGDTGATGPQGLIGSPGEDGTNGTQGPSGITFINSTNSYQVFGEVANSNSALAVSSAALCEEGDTVIVGGWTAVIANADPVILSDRPFNPFGNFNGGYIVTMIGGGQQFFTTAYCFDNPPAHIP